MILISQATLNYFCGRLASRRATDKIRRKDKLSELLWMLNAGGKWIYSPRSYVSGIRAALKKGRSQSARRPEDMEIFRKGGLCLGVWKEVTFRIRKGQLIELIRKQAMEISGISCTFQEINNWLKEKKLQHLPSESKMLKGDHSACSLCHMYISVSSLISMLFLRELLIWRLYSYKKSKNNPGIACSSCNFANCVEFQNPTQVVFTLLFQMSSATSSFESVCSYNSSGSSTSTKGLSLDRMKKMIKSELLLRLLKRNMESSSRDPGVFKYHSISFPEWRDKVRLGNISEKIFGVSVPNNIWFKS